MFVIELNLHNPLPIHLPYIYKNEISSMNMCLRDMCMGVNMVKVAE